MRKLRDIQMKGDSLKTFNLYPALKIHHTTIRQSSRKPNVAATLIPTFTSKIPAKTPGEAAGFKPQRPFAAAFSQFVYVLQRLLKAAVTPVQKAAIFRIPKRRRLACPCPNSI
jgi:hypothetical protein